MIKLRVIILQTFLGIACNLNAQNDTIVYFENTSIVAFQVESSENKQTNKLTIYCNSGNKYAEYEIFPDRYTAKYYYESTRNLYKEIILFRSDIEKDLRKVKFIERYIRYILNPYEYGELCSPFNLIIPSFSFDSKYFDEGVFSEFYSNGQLMHRIKIKKGQIDGDYSEFYSNGNLACNGLFKENQKVGMWKYYYENGKLAAKGKFQRLLVYEDLPGKDSLTIWNNYNKIEAIKTGADYAEFAMQKNKNDKYLILMAQEIIKDFDGQLNNFFNVSSFHGLYAKYGKWISYDENQKKHIEMFVDGIKVRK
jgi:antitoxin component YwqK of YwqJK toxin-antitoxin module